MIKGLQLLAITQRQLPRTSCSAYSRYDTGNKLGDSKAYTQDDLKQFAGMTADKIHLDPQIAHPTQIDKPMVPGVLKMG